MPEPKENNVDNKNNTNDINTNSEGKIYPWAIEGRDYALYKMLNGYGIQLGDSARIINREKKAEDLYVDMTSNIADDNDSLSPDDAKMVVGGSGGSLVLFSETAGLYYKPDQIQEVTDRYKDLRKMQEEISDHLRGKYKGKDDASSRHYQEKANEFADMLDLDSEVADPEKGGNLFRAFFDAPYMSRLRAIAGATPRFGRLGFEKCVDIMDQKDSNGRSIYDDYMTMMGAASREQKVQFHRQQMEKDGWDADKEKTYLNELRLEHQKSIEAFDNLWEINDHKQYDSALNNTLDDLVGKDLSQKRDANASIGYMRGEVRAIDLGYDSKHLHILGQVGMQEQELKKIEAGLAIAHGKAEKDIEDFRKNPDEVRSRYGYDDATLESLQNKLQDIEGRQQQLEEYRNDFTGFKKSLWDKKVNSLEDMQAADRQVNDFFSSHNEKYGDLQRCHATYKQGIDYNKEMAARATEMIKPSPKLFVDDITGLNRVVSTQIMLGKDEFIENGTMKMGILMSEGTSSKNQLEHRIGEPIPLTDSFSKEVSGLAKEFSDGIDAYKDSHKTPDHPRTQAYRDALLDFAKLHTEAISAGRHLSDDKRSQEYTDAYGMISTLVPQLSNKFFAPENSDKTEAALKNYPLDKFIRQALDIHKMESSYKDRKDSMTQKEKDAFQESLREKKEDFLDTAKELHEKSLNPSKETLSFFGNPSLLTSDTGFIGKRGLGTMISDYDKEFAKTDISDNQMDKLSSALRKVSAKRAGLFDSEGDDRRFMREQAEKMQENLKKLKSGMIDTPTGPRPMTQNEKTDLLADTIDGLNDLSSKTDNYIKHATKNGTKTPTGAGKTRLDGARELKDLTNDLQDTLMKEQQAQMKQERNRAQRQAAAGANQNTGGGAVRENTVNKENGRKSISFKEIQEKDRKTTEERRRRNSVRESAKRPKIENTKHGQNDALQNNRAITPKKK